MNKNGLLTIPFSRAVIFPVALIADYDSQYDEVVPKLEPNKADLDWLKLQFEEYQEQYDEALLNLEMQFDDEESDEVMDRHGAEIEEEDESRCEEKDEGNEGPGGKSPD